MVLSGFDFVLIIVSQSWFPAFFSSSSFFLSALRAIRPAAASSAHAGAYRTGHSSDAGVGVECRGLRFCYGRVRALLTSSMPGGMWWGYAHAGRASRCGTVLSFCLLFVFLRVPLWGLADLRRIAAGTVCLGVLCALFLWFVVFVFFGLLILCAPFGPGWPPPRHGGHGWPRDAIFLIHCI